MSASASPHVKPRNLPPSGGGGSQSKKNAHVVRILLAYLYLFSDNPEMWSWLRDTSPVRGHPLTEEEWEDVGHLYKQVKLRESFTLTSALVPASL